MRKLQKQGFAPDVLVTDKLRALTGAAKAELGLSARHEQGLRKNNPRMPRIRINRTRRRERKIATLQILARISPALPVDPRRLSSTSNAISPPAAPLRTILRETKR